MSGDKVDYLYEDPVIGSQKYVCISVLTPKNFKEPTTMSTLKVRGCYETVEEAKKRADFLRNIDPHINVYVGEVGKWLPFDDDPEKAKDHEYQNKRLNDMMKGYLENQQKAKEFHEIRKNDMVMKALKENEEKEKRRQARQVRRDAGETVDDDAEENAYMEQQKELENQNRHVVESLDEQIEKTGETNLNRVLNDLDLNIKEINPKDLNLSDKKVENKSKELKDRQSELKKKEQEISKDKEEIAKTQEEYNKYQQKTEKIKKELEEAKRVYEAMLAAGIKK